jgi:hypothetical protein
MSSTANEILAAFRSGALTAEEAARRLLPLLQTSGPLDLDLGLDVQPLVEALRHLASPGRPSTPQSIQPLVWQSRHWQRLDRVPEDFWHILRGRHLDQSPQCLRYVFTVRSAAAATALEDWILDHSDHRVSVQLPESFHNASGEVVGHTPAKRWTKPDLVTWVGWLRSIPPVAEAALTDLGIASPPPDAG